jgi:hypothetical protein
MSDLVALKRTASDAHKETSKALEAIMFLAKHLESRPSGPLQYEDSFGLHALVTAFGHCAADERGSFDDVADAVEAKDRARKSSEDEFKRRQQAAHSAVAAAVVSGALVRSSHCERCPTVADNTVAHHHDYDKPLDVEWLCRPCHGKHHAEHGPAL